MMVTSSPYQNESSDLELHVAVCAERYKQLDDRLANLENGMTVIRDDIIDGNKSLRNTVIASVSTIVVALITVAGAVITRML